MSHFKKKLIHDKGKWKKEITMKCRVCGRQKPKKYFRLPDGRLSPECERCSRWYK